MTHLWDMFTNEELQDALNRNLVSMTRHPADRDWVVYNYTPVAQYSREWSNVTTKCRGLVVWNPSHKVLARPFPKFFNLGELSRSDVRLSKTFELREKMDGSLGIAYEHPDGRTAIATRGSFSSDQATWATNWLRSHHPDWESPEGITTLFEIIYPENRIVVDYGDRAELVLIGAIVNATGEDVPMDDVDWWPGERARSFGFVEKARHAEEILKDARLDGHEGLVAAYYKAGEPAFRVKLKREEYVELHRIVFGLSSHTIWEALREGQDARELVAVLPDEMHEWARSWADDLTAQHAGVMGAASSDYHDLTADLEDRMPEAEEREYRKAFAATATKRDYPGIMFALLDERYDAASDAAWKLCEPARERLR